VKRQKPKTSFSFVLVFSLVPLIRFVTFVSTDLTIRMRYRPISDVHVSTTLHPMTQDEEDKTINVISSQLGIT
jgi:hypothetical protein